LVYQAPEILEGSSNYNQRKTDVYSFGVLLWQIFTQKEPFSFPPYNNWEKRAIADFVVQGKRLEIPKGTNPRIVSLIGACWDAIDENRPDFTPTIVPTLEDVLAKTPTTPKPVSPEPIVNHSQSQSQLQASLSKGSIPSPMLGHSASNSGSVSSVTVPPPRCDLQKIGWWGDIEREVAEEKLKAYPRGYFLIRYSPRRKCYVLSYNGPAGVKHIDSISLNPLTGFIEVVRIDGTKPSFPTMLDYVISLRTVEKLITDPVPIKLVQESNYEQTPTMHG